LHTIRERLKKYVVDFDLSSWYDQFLLHPKVQRYFGIRTTKGTFVHRTLPMGFRPACLVAQTASEILGDLPDRERLFLAIYIDNFLISADTPEECIAAGNAFVERCRQAGAILNDNDIPMEATVKQQFEFLGVKYDLVAETVQQSEKTIRKLEVVNEVMETQMTHRQVAAVFGLLFWANSVLPMDLSQFFNALRYYRKQGSVHDHEWNNTAEQPSAQVKRELREWVRQALTAKPQPLRIVDPPEEATILVDASSYGWGAMCISAKGVMTAGDRWSMDDWAQWNLHSSVAAEPLAYTRAIAAFCDAAC
jgi:hypothetical protein